MWGLLVPLALVFTLALGFVIGLQWMPTKTGGPPPKPMPNWLGVLVAILLVSGVVGIVVFVLSNRGIF
ncbi:MAG: hypothetical protein FWD97_01215 [Defluviitaleaceae bacterium]|nr:hypothetical protein [Defluviitaleaceae bacterium]